MRPKTIKLTKDQFTKHMALNNALGGITKAQMGIAQSKYSNIPGGIHERLRIVGEELARIKQDLRNTQDPEIWKFFNT